jgi:D-glycero-alpha-D-manno-heptose 1-phosphate guanylyltransferase
MKAIILAGGEGTRLKEVISDIPKPMAPIAGKPFLEYLVMQLRHGDIRDIILSTGYRKEVVKNYFGTGEKWGARISYSEEDVPLGTGGAVKKALDLLEIGPTIVLNGDSFLEADIMKLIVFHKTKNACATICLAFMEDTSRYGRVEIDSEGGVLCFAEKAAGSPGFINGGIYIFNKEILTSIPEGKVSLETEVLPQLVGRGLYGMETKGFFRDIGIPEDYLDLKENPQQLMAALK